MKKDEIKDETYNSESTIDSLQLQIQQLKVEKNKKIHDIDSKINELELQIQQQPYSETHLKKKQKPQIDLKKKNNEQKINIFLSSMFIIGIILAMLYILVING